MNIYEAAKQRGKYPPPATNRKDKSGYAIIDSEDGRRFFASKFTRKMCNSARKSHMIYQVIKKRNQSLFGVLTLSAMTKRQTKRQIQREKVVE